MRKKKSISVLAGLFTMAGLILTLENYALLKGISQFWPVLLLITGSGFILLFFNIKRKDAALMWLGSFMMLLSIFFFCLNSTSWRNLTYLWPVFLGIVGISFLTISIFTKEKIYTYLSIFLMALFIAFYFVFTVSYKLWPMSLVMFGICLLVTDYFNAKNKSEGEKANE